MNPATKLRATVKGFDLALRDFSRRTTRHRKGLLRYREFWSELGDILIHDADIAGSHRAVEAALHKMLIVQCLFLHRVLNAEDKADDTSPAPVLAREPSSGRKRESNPSLELR